MACQHSSTPGTTTEALLPAEEDVNSIITKSQHQMITHWTQLINSTQTHTMMLRGECIEPLNQSLRTLSDEQQLHPLTNFQDCIYKFEVVHGDLEHTQEQWDLKAEDLETPLKF